MLGESPPRTGGLGASMFAGGRTLVELISTPLMELSNISVGTVVAVVLKTPSRVSKLVPSGSSAH